jgi:hypothetical protein
MTDSQVQRYCWHEVTPTNLSDTIFPLLEGFVGKKVIITVVWYFIGGTPSPASTNVHELSGLADASDEGFLQLFVRNSSHLLVFPGQKIYATEGDFQMWSPNERSHTIVTVV